jgi:hypothetical protein
MEMLPMGFRQPQTLRPSGCEPILSNLRSISMRYITLRSNGLDEFIPISSFDATIPSQDQRSLHPLCDWRGDLSGVGMGP